MKKKAVSIEREITHQSSVERSRKQTIEDELSSKLVSETEVEE